MAETHEKLKHEAKKHYCLGHVAALGVTFGMVGTTLDIVGMITRAPALPWVPMLLFNIGFTGLAFWGMKFHAARWAETTSRINKMQEIKNAFRRDGV